MTKEQLLGIVRHTATAVGAGLVVTGKVDESLVQEATGALLSIAALVWSLYEKTLRAR